MKCLNCSHTGPHVSREREDGEVWFCGECGETIRLKSANRSRSMTKLLVENIRRVLQ